MGKRTLWSTFIGHKMYFTYLPLPCNPAYHGITPTTDVSSQEIARAHENHVPHVHTNWCSFPSSSFHVARA